MAKTSYELTHPTTGETITANFDDQGTPRQLIEQLLEQEWLEAAGKGEYCLVYTKQQKQLAYSETFVAQEIPEGAELSFRVRANGAAPRRTGPPVERLRLDYRSLQNIAHRGCIGAITAYADRDLKAPIKHAEEAHRMRRYTVEYKIPLPVDERRRADRWRVLFELESDWRHYPSAKLKPNVQFLGRIPWHYRVSTSGRLCTLPVGSAGYVAGQHVGIVAGLVNADEPFEKAHDKGYRPEAYRYYRSRFDGPVNPGLVIPEVEPSVFAVEPSVTTPKLELGPRGRSESPAQASPAFALKLV